MLQFHLTDDFSHETPTKKFTFADYLIAQLVTPTYPFTLEVDDSGCPDDVVFLVSLLKMYKYNYGVYDGSHSETRPLLIAAVTKLLKGLKLLTPKEPIRQTLNMWIDNDYESEQLTGCKELLFSLLGINLPATSTTTTIVCK